MQNSCVNLINKKIAKLEREVGYFENKADLPTFHRDRLTYVNSDDWVEYWIEVARYKEKVIDEYYTLLKIVNRNGIGDIKFPDVPKTKELA